MPLPTPHKKETENDFIGRCVPLVIDLEGLDKNDEKERKQAVAICYAQWRKAKGGKAMEIEDMVGLSFDVDGEEVPFEELVKAYEGIKAEKGEKEEWHLTKTDIKELIAMIDAELDRRKREKEKKGEKSVALEDMTTEELEDSLFNACPARGGLSKSGWMSKARSWVKSAATRSLAGYRRRLVMIGTKMGMSFKALSLEGKALSLDELARQVRDAWRSEFVKPGVPGEVSGSYWPKEVFDDQVIVETPQGLYAYPYTIGEDGEVEFGEPVKVEVQYRPVGEGEKAWQFGPWQFGPGQSSLGANEDAMIAFGGEIKALGGGKVGGYLVRFGAEDEKDLTGEFFTAKTYYGPANGDGADTLVHHGLPLPHDVTDPEVKAELNQLAGRILSPMKTKRDALGIWAEIILNLADEYEKMIHGMVEKAKLKWSSRSVFPLIRKKSNGEIERWPIVEGSLTPIPAEFRGTQVMPLKSYLKAIGMGEAPKGGGGSGDPRLEAVEAIARSQLLLTEIEQET